MTLQRRQRSYFIASRIRVANVLRPHAGRREIVKSLKAMVISLTSRGGRTAYPSANLAAA